MDTHANLPSLLRLSELPFNKNCSHHTKKSDKHIDIEWRSRYCIYIAMQNHRHWKMSHLEIAEQLLSTTRNGLFCFLAICTIL